MERPIAGLLPKLNAHPLAADYISVGHIYLTTIRC